jgi:hypothetical protein
MPEKKTSNYGRHATLQNIPKPHNRTRDPTAQALHALPLLPLQPLILPPQENPQHGAQQRRPGLQPDTDAQREPITRPVGVAIRKRGPDAGGVAEGVHDGVGDGAFGGRAGHGAGGPA